MFNVLLVTAITVAAMFVLPELVARVVSWMLSAEDKRKLSSTFHIIRRGKS